MNGKNMKIAEKLRGRNGESLVEVLVTLLICVLGLGLLSTAIITSSAITKNSDKKVNEYYDALNAVAGKDPEAAEEAEKAKKGKGKVRISGNGFEEETFEAEYYINETYGNTPVISYRKETEAP